MDEVVSFLNANKDKISYFEGGEHYFLIHMKNGDTVEIFYGLKELLVHHYKD